MPLGLEILKRPKSPPEIVAKAVAALQNVEARRREDRDVDKALESVSKYLGFMKFQLFGDEGHDPTKEQVMVLAHEVVKTDLLLLLVQDLSALDFETRKDAAQVFGAIVRIRDAEDRSPGAVFVQKHRQILMMLFNGQAPWAGAMYDEPSIALNCGAMFRDCIRDETLASVVFDSPAFMDFFDKVEVANFEIASDAFSSFKDLLTRHKALVAAFLTEHYTPFFDAYAQLLQSTNYVTRRQSLKLLGELLLDRTNVKLMMRYVSDAKNLMQMMNLLKDGSRNIQFEAFHVFKVFVANPNKPQAIIDILTNNRGKLLKYLEDFHTDKDPDEQFKEEKAVIIKEISRLGMESEAPGMVPVAPAPGVAQAPVAGQTAE